MSVAYEYRKVYTTVNNLMNHYLVGLLLLAVTVGAQLRVLEPQSLSREFRREDEDDDTKYDDIIPASTATFGSPTYGEFFMGQLLVMNSTGCSFDYNEQMNHNTTGALRKVVMVNRGDCPFVDKVLVAEKAGADAVVIADFATSLWDAHQIKRVIMADNGNGQRVRIPSILITKRDADILANAAAKTPITVSMDWSLPQKDVVTVDFWYVSGSTEAMNFLSQVEPAVKRLKGVVDFRPHIYVVRLTSVNPDADSMVSSNDLVEERCFDGDPTLCTQLADVSTTTTAEDILEENVREMCLLKMTSVPIPLLNNPARKVLYSDVWWQYVKEISEFCPLKPEQQKGENRFGPNCSLNLMVKLGQNPMNISECVEMEARNLLVAARENNAWGNLALRINGARFSGNFEPSLVFKAICSAFASEPSECKGAIQDLSAATTVSDHGREVSRATGSWAHTVTLLLLMVLATIVVTYIYHAWRESSRRQAIRHEVQMEVKSQLQDYYRIADPPLTRWNNSQHSESRETEFSNLKFR